MRYFCVLLSLQTFQPCKVIVVFTLLQRWKHLPFTVQEKERIHRLRKVAPTIHHITLKINASGTIHIFASFSLAFNSKPKSSSFYLLSWGFASSSLTLLCLLACLFHQNLTPLISAHCYVNDNPAFSVVRGFSVCWVRHGIGAPEVCQSRHDIR